MKLLIVSDTHGYYTRVIRAYKQSEHIDYIIHLGDYISDAVKAENELNKQIDYVKGNCDFSDGKVEKILTLENKKIFMTHGHLYHVKYGYDYIIEKGMSLKADIVLFGHTHIPEMIFSGSSMFLNPGSLGEPRNGRKPTYGIIDISCDKVNAKIVNLK